MLDVPADAAKRVRDAAKPFVDYLEQASPGSPGMGAVACPLAGATSPRAPRSRACLQRDGCMPARPTMLTVLPRPCAAACRRRSLSLRMTTSEESVPLCSSASDRSPLDVWYERRAP